MKTFQISIHCPTCNKGCVLDSDEPFPESSKFHCSDCRSEIMWQPAKFAYECEHGISQVPCLRCEKESTKRVVCGDPLTGFNKCHQNFGHHGHHMDSRFVWRHAGTGGSTYRCKQTNVHGKRCGLTEKHGGQCHEADHDDVKSPFPELKIMVKGEEVKNFAEGIFVKYEPDTPLFESFCTECGANQIGGDIVQVCGGCRASAFTFRRLCGARHPLGAVCTMTKNHKGTVHYNREKVWHDDAALFARCQKHSMCWYIHNHPAPCSFLDLDGKSVQAKGEVLDKVAEMAGSDILARRMLDEFDEAFKKRVGAMWTSSQLHVPTFEEIHKAMHSIGPISVKGKITVGGDPRAVLDVAARFVGGLDLRKHGQATVDEQHDLVEMTSEALDRVSEGEMSKRIFPKGSCELIGAFHAFLCALNFQDHPVDEQRESLRVIKLLRDAKDMYGY